MWNASEPNDLCEDDAATMADLADVSGPGDQAYCGSSGPSFARLAHLSVLKGGMRLSVSADTCAHA